jgi:hypothetical protein
VAIRWRYEVRCLKSKASHHSNFTIMYRSLAGAPVRIKLRTRMLLKLRYNRPPLQVRFPVEVCILARHAAKEVRGGVAHSGAANTNRYGIHSAHPRARIHDLEMPSVIMSASGTFVSRAARARALSRSPTIRSSSYSRRAEAATRSRLA